MRTRNILPRRSMFMCRPPLTLKTARTRPNGHPSWLAENVRKSCDDHPTRQANLALGQAKANVLPVRVETPQAPGADIGVGGSDEQQPRMLSESSARLLRGLGSFGEGFLSFAEGL